MDFLCSSQIPIMKYIFLSFVHKCILSIFIHTFLLACGCNINGTESDYDEQKREIFKCTDNGQCTCKEGKNIDGDKCDRCREGFTNFPECDKCLEANKWGENCHDSKC